MQMHLHDMVGENGIPVGIVLIPNDENHVETRENSWHEIDIAFALRVIPSTKYAVGGRKNRAAAVKRSRDTSLHR